MSEGNTKWSEVAHDETTGYGVCMLSYDGNGIYSVISEYGEIIAEFTRNVTAIDIVAVVRCKDCVLLNKQLCRASVCTAHNLKTGVKAFKTLMESDGYCNIGERRASNEND